MKKEDIKTITKKQLKPFRDLEPELIPFGDIHKGSINHNAPFYKKILKWIYDNEENYVVLMGDLIEMGTKNSHGTFEQTMTPNEQMYEIIDDFKELAKQGRILGLLQGNHEERCFNETGIDVCEAICKMLNVEYFFKGIMIDMRVQKQRYDTYFTHGFSSANTASGKMNACRQLSSAYQVELYCMGHVHALDQNKQDVYRMKNGKEEIREIHYVLTGCYMDYVGSYAQAHGISLRTLGSPKIKFHSKYHRISVSI